VPGIGNDAELIYNEASQLWSLISQQIPFLGVLSEDQSPVDLLLFVEQQEVPVLANAFSTANQ